MEDIVAGHEERLLDPGFALRETICQALHRTPPFQGWNPLEGVARHREFRQSGTRNEAYSG